LSDITSQPLVTKELIAKLLVCSDDDLVEMLKSTIAWRFGKVRVVRLEVHSLESEVCPG
jgi:hypothetical protein